MCMGMFVGKYVFAFAYLTTFKTYGKIFTVLYLGVWVMPGVPEVS